MDPMYIPVQDIPVKNTFIQFDSLPELRSLLLPKSTTAPPEYHPGHLLRAASRTVSTQTQSTSANTPTAGYIESSSFYAAQNSAGPFYASQNQTAKSETDSEPAQSEDPIPEEEQPLQENQIRVASDHCGVEWAPGSKKLGRYSAEHQVVSSRFELHVCGRSVGFLLMIRPARTQNRRGVMRAAFKNTQKRQIQMKCLDDMEGLPNTPVQVTFTVGTEQRMMTYDFQSPVCEPTGDQGLWDLNVPKDADPVCIKVRISAAPSRW